MKSIFIIPFQENTPALFAAIKEFPVEKVVLVFSSKDEKKVEEVKKDFKKFQLPVDEITLKANTTLEEMLSVVGHIKEKEKDANLLMHLGASREPLHCYGLSAAFVHGLTAFTMDKGKPWFYPVLKFSYYDLLSEKKLRLLELLAETNCCDSLESLSRRATIGPSLVNYHLYGDDKTQGLISLGLVEVAREKGKIQATLTTLGKLLLNDKIAAREK